MIRVTLALASGVAALFVTRLARTAAVRSRVRAEASAAPGRLPRAVRAHLDRELRRADIDTDPESLLQVWGVATVASFVFVAAVVPSLLWVVAVGAIGAPVVAARVARSRADRRIEAALPDLLRRLAADLRTGGSLRAALIRSGSEPGPVRRDCAAIAARIELGASVVAAVGPWSSERPIASVATVSGALACLGESGGAAASALEGLARSLADRLAVLDEHRAQAAQARVSAVVVGCAPLGYLAISTLLDRDAIGALVARPIGQICLVVGIALDALALVWMQRIVRAPGAGS